MDTTNHKLRYLNQDDDYKVHHDDPDIRDWDVYTTTGEEIGEVENLIFDPVTKKVRYAVVELEDDLFENPDRSWREKFTDEINEFFGRDDDQHILIPIGLIRVDRDNKKVYARTSQPNTYYMNAPRYEYKKGTEYIGSPAYELAVARWYAQHDEDDNVRNYYSTDRYSDEHYRTLDRHENDEFYNTPMFSRDLYDRSTSAATTTNMATTSPAGPMKR